MKLCGAKTRAGGTCQQAALQNGRCRFHGGKSLGGLASPALKTGKYSRFLPTRLSANYEASLSDPRLLELREEISVLDARLQDLISRVDTGESGAVWRNLHAAHSDVKAARRSGDTTAQAEALNALLGLVERGHADYAAWRELGSVIDARRKLVESERKRLQESHQMITADRAMLLMGAIVGIIKEHVHDRATLNAVSNAINALALAEGSE